MRKGLLITTIAMVAVIMAWTPAQAGDQFENGFKFQMGAIAARATIGLGAGIVHDVTHRHDHGYNRHVGHRHIGHRHDRWCGHRVYRRHAPAVVVYRPYAPRVRYVDRHVARHTHGGRCCN